MIGLPVDADRRAFGRRKIQQHAFIHLRGVRPVRCLVTDLSEGGARLELAQLCRLPLSFRLEWEGIGLEAMCETRHQDTTTVGAMFTDGQGPEILKAIFGKPKRRSAPVKT